MRLVKTCAAALLAATLPVHALATPLNWPDTAEGEPALAFHCAAVMTAFGRAYVYATELMDQPQASPVGALPETFLALAGGADRMTDIQSLADAWAMHSESLGATNFYPRLARDGTPYLADDGRELMLAVQQCADRFDL